MEKTKNVKRKIKFGLFVVGLLLLVIGGACLIKPNEMLNAFSWIVGLLMLLAGIILFLVWGRFRESMPEPSLLFFSAFMQVLLGILFMVNPAWLSSGVGFVFGFWVLFEGVSIVLESIDFHRDGYKRWWLSCIIGVIAVLIGIMLVFRVNLAESVLAIFIGLGIIISGVGYFMKLSGINKFERLIKEVKEDMNRLEIE